MLTDTPLVDLAARGDVDGLRSALAAGASPRLVVGNAFTPLHAAAMFGHAAACAVLLEAGADPDAQTRPQLYAPLHSAAFAGHIEAIRVLLRAGARLDLRNYRGERPVETAARTGQPGDVLALLTPPPEG